MAYRPTGRPNGRPRKPRQMLAGEIVDITDLDLTSRSRPDSVFMRRRLDALTKSIDHRGLGSAVIVLPNGTLLSGHLRIQALERLTTTTVPVVVVNSADEAYAALAGEVEDDRLAPSPWDVATLVEVDELVKRFGDKHTFRQRADGFRISVYRLQSSRRIIAATRSSNPEKVNEAFASIAALNLGRRSLRKVIRDLDAIRPLPTDRAPQARRTPAGHSEVDAIMRDIEDATERLKLVRRAEMSKTQTKQTLARLRESQRILRRTEVVVRRANPSG